jgi:hypothetical protein
MIAHVISVVVALKNGLGTSPALAARIDNSDDLAKAGSATLAAYMLLIVALALAKGSTIMFVETCANCISFATACSLYSPFGQSGR